MCGEEIFQTTTIWLETSNFPPQVNNTSIVLIPKTLNPTTMNDFRLISLCNVLYKITSKVIANILKPIIHNCISQEQVVFVENRSILDNIFLASKIIHHMKCKQKWKVGEVALKTDINKALKFVQYPILINGDPNGQITSRRWLKQGNPLSSYLFIMFTEGLSSLIKHIRVEEKFME